MSEKEKGKVERRRQTRGAMKVESKEERASKQEIEKIKEQTRELEEGSSQIQVTKSVF